MTLLEELNYIAVTVFGCVLSFSFSGVEKSRRASRICTGTILLILALQAVVSASWGTGVTRSLYPAISHLPLLLVLMLAVRCAPLWALVSILMAYLCCQPRRWLGSVVLALSGENQVLFLLTEIIITIPLLILFIRFASPKVRQWAQRPISTQLLVGLAPLLFYLYDYLFVIYTDLLYSGVTVVVEFMPSVFCVLFLLFLLLFSKEEEHCQFLQSSQMNLNTQLAESLKKLDALRQSQRQTATYRHDLRHHLQYLATCIESGQKDAALDYIHQVNHQIETQKMVAYCENEPVNLILTAYAAKAQKQQMQLIIEMKLPAALRIPANDLCVLLSNVLENAMTACMELPQALRRIQICGYEKNSVIFLQVSNPCGSIPAFQDGMPITTKFGHGMGTKSIAMIAERCGGVCSFSATNGQFVFRASL